MIMGDVQGRARTHGNRSWDRNNPIIGFAREVELAGNVAGPIPSVAKRRTAPGSTRGLPPLEVALAFAAVIYSTCRSQRRLAFELRENAQQNEERFACGCAGGNWLLDRLKRDRLPFTS